MSSIQSFIVSIKSTLCWLTSLMVSSSLVSSLVPRASRTPDSSPSRWWWIFSRTFSGIRLAGLGFSTLVLFNTGASTSGLETTLESPAVQSRLKVPWLSSLIAHSSATHTRHQFCLAIEFELVSKEQTSCFHLCLFSESYKSYNENDNFSNSSDILRSWCISNSIYCNKDCIGWRWIRWLQLDGGRIKWRLRVHSDGGHRKQGEEQCPSRCRRCLGTILRRTLYQQWAMYECDRHMLGQNYSGMPSSHLVLVNSCHCSCSLDCLHRLLHHSLVIRLHHKLLL